MKNMTGWVILDTDGYPVCFDHRMPCYWLRKTAKADAEKNGFWRIKKVTLKISLLPQD